MNIGNISREPDLTSTQETYEIPIDDIINSAGIREPIGSFRDVGLRGGKLIVIIRTTTSR